MSKKIHIGADHAGFKLKEQVKAYLMKLGYDVDDKGSYSEERADYPDFGHAVATEVESSGDLGVLMCGSGNGIAMSANRHAGIRAALAWEPEIAKLAREHNDANILVLPARFIKEDTAMEIVDAFLKATFEGGRHQVRVEKIDLKDTARK
jgi:ribose 5-phosphate isomerase B